MELWSDEQQAPLRHVRVVDMTVMVPGPFVTRFLAQYGADVIKIEQSPEGDPLRKVPNTAVFELLNQGKRSVALDLNAQESVGIVRRLACESDIFVENFRDGVMDRYGLGYADLSEENPDILYCSMRGVSAQPSRAAHDLNFVAASGCGEWFLENGSPNFSTHFGDLIGGTLVPLLKVLSHLANPNRQGMHLVSYLDEGFRALYLPRAWDALRSESAPQSARAEYGLIHYLDGKQPHSRYYRCRDGQWISLNAIQHKHWEVFCEAVDKPQWKGRQGDSALSSELEMLFADAPASYWEVLVKGKDTCLFRVIPWEEHVATSDTRSKMTTDPLGWAGFVARGDLTPSPSVGHDTLAILTAAGIGNKELTDLLHRRILFQAPGGEQKHSQ
jgi:crotonobetainyl-CoA:carnitine CoA-transferase CaiB-like acyl-CoA transferase